ncbi:MAG: DNA-3-methyladenine glycosylase, partial [Acidimicrobiales bacterium]
AAFGIDGSHDGSDLVRADRGVSIRDDGTAPPPDPLTSPRVGISRATDRPWRFSVPGCPGVSRPLPHREGSSG